MDHNHNTSLDLRVGERTPRSFRSRFKVRMAAVLVALLAFGGLFMAEGQSPDVAVESNSIASTLNLSSLLSNAGILSFFTPLPTGKSISVSPPGIADITTEQATAELQQAAASPGIAMAKVGTAAKQCRKLLSLRVRTARSKKIPRRLKAQLLVQIDLTIRLSLCPPISP